MGHCGKLRVDVSSISMGSIIAFALHPRQYAVEGPEFHSPTQIRHNHANQLMVGESQQQIYYLQQMKYYRDIMFLYSSNAMMLQLSCGTKTIEQVEQECARTLGGVELECLTIK